MIQASTLSVRTDKDLKPNKTTLKAVEEIEKGKNIKRFQTAEELFEDLGI
jgi:antitoxin component of RelBE/YafQ-DinJ toxin-antitoxin module